MILKLELYLDVDTKEPQVTKQIYQEVLTQALKDIIGVTQEDLNKDSSFLKGRMSIKNFYSYQNDLFWDYSEQLRKLGLNFSSKGVSILDIDQVAERMRIGINKENRG